MTEQEEQIAEMGRDLSEQIEWDEWAAVEYGQLEIDTYGTAMNMYKLGYRKITADLNLTQPNELAKILHSKINSVIGGAFNITYDEALKVADYLINECGYQKPLFSKENKGFEITKIEPKQDESGKTYWTAYTNIDGCVGGGYSKKEAEDEARKNMEIFSEYLSLLETRRKG